MRLSAYFIHFTGHTMPFHKSHKSQTVKQHKGQFEIEGKWQQTGNKEQHTQHEIIMSCRPWKLELFQAYGYDGLVNIHYRWARIQILLQGGEAMPKMKEDRTIDDGCMEGEVRDWKKNGG